MDWILTCLGNAKGTAEINGQSFRTEPGVKYGLHTLPDFTPETGIALRSLRGKLGDSGDSLLFCGTRVFPDQENFELSAQFTVSRPEKTAGWQSGYGLFAVDTIASENAGCRFRNMLSVGRHRAQRYNVCDCGLRVVSGYQDPSAAEAGRQRALDASRTGGPDLFPESICAGETCRLTLKKTDAGFEAAIRVGDREERLSFPGCDFLLRQDPTGFYAGFGAAGELTVCISDLQYHVLPGRVSRTPAGAIHPSVPDYPFPRSLMKELPEIRAHRRIRRRLYVSPEGTAKGRGSRANPLDLQTALCAAGSRTQITLLDGTYRPEHPILVPRHSGNRLVPVEAEHVGRVVLDGSRLSEKMPVMILLGDRWRVTGIAFTNSPSAGLFVCGNANRIACCSAFHNRDTGILLCTLPGSSRGEWPSDNIVFRCDSWENCDEARANADGFGAKLSIGDGNRFVECIAHHNIDDGFDLYAKNTLGPTGSVTLEGCVAYRNGHLPDEEPVSRPAGRGVGFKLGGEGQSVTHTAQNCIAYCNDQYGFSSNSNPAVQLLRLTAWENGRNPRTDNYHLFTAGESVRPEWKTEGLLPEAGTDAESFQKRFISCDTVLSPDRTADGRICMHGLFVPKKKTDDGSGALRAAVKTNTDVSSCPPAVSPEKAGDARPVLLFMVPRTSGGGAEKVITSLASQMTADYRVFLVTTVREDGQKGYPFSDEITYLNLYDWTKGRQSTGREMAESPAEMMDSSSDAVPAGKNALLSALSIRLRHLLRGSVQKLTNAAPESVREFAIQKQFLFQVRSMRALKKELQADIAVSFLNSANYINVLSRGTERCIISVRSCLEGPFAPADCRTAEGRQRITDACAGADRIVPVSRETANSLLRRYGAQGEKLRVIYNYVDIPHIREKAKEPLPESPLAEAVRQASFVWISVGRLTEKKGQWHIVRAFREVVRRQPGAILILLGKDGKKQENVAPLLREIIAANGLEEHVFLGGFMENPYSWLSRGDAYVMSSFNEGFPNALAEAMTVGLPVVSSDCRSGPREILAPGTDYTRKTESIDYAQYGILVPECSGNRLIAEPPEREEALLAEAMCRLTDNRELRNRYSVRSVERVLHFQKEETLRLWKEVIEDED